ncbi:hypothetical protein ABXT08_01965 [Chryseobacterium sp. NRRL B-14859]|uniref:hypothetical protein n=1 Tax=unclassified Chryseobacterium TaxID=2593645 RepID=UPI000F44AB7F|nr:hypothetical protein [Chryseobacterium sp. G0240]ROI02270.1 hypothetical protein EGI16_15465 [Chryseobacterium sp. G0240]
MKARLLLSGVLLLSIVTACSDREEEIAAPADQKKENKMEMERTETAKFTEDALIKKDSLNGAHSKQEDGSTPAAVTQETIDPTKPDRPK